MVMSILVSCLTPIGADTVGIANFIINTNLVLCYLHLQLKYKHISPLTLLLFTVITNNTERNIKANYWNIITLISIN